MKAPLFVLLLGLVLFSCSKDDDDDDVCDTSDITYTNTVASIMNNNCALSGCHVDGNEMVAFFSLEGYTKAKGAADFGRIVGAISHESGFSPMPKGSNKLDQCTIDQIAAWVDAGAPE
jgi:hypothetical protein